MDWNQACNIDLVDGQTEVAQADVVVLVEEHVCSVNSKCGLSFVAPWFGLGRLWYRVTVVPDRSQMLHTGDNCEAVPMRYSCLLRMRCTAAECRYGKPLTVVAIKGSSVSTHN